MTYGSVCSGIEAVTAAWHPLGYSPAWFAEVAPFPSAVLAHHYPGVTNHGDFTRLLREPPAAVDVLAGGTPCQSFSVAGLRGGLSDPRGNLALAYVALAGLLRPRWVVWENVPGVLSADGGDAFRCILAGLVECGYGVCYRVLDAQHFGVAQRRQRVFVVGCVGGDWRLAAAVLLEPEGVRRDSPPRREAGPGVAGALGTGASGGGGWRVGADEAAAGHVVPTRGAAGTYDRGDGNDALVPVDLQNHALGGDLVGTLDTSRPGRGGGQAVLYSIVQEAQTGVREYDTAGALRANGPGHDPVGSRVLAPAPIGFSVATCTQGMACTPDGMPPLTRRNGDPGTAFDGRAVRRLLPVECERLQGFPDGWTDIPYRGRSAPDGSRYQALGNSMAVPVVRWIGRRIDMVDRLLETS